MVSGSDGWAVGGIFTGPPNWLSGWIYRWNGSAWSKVNSTSSYQYLADVEMLDASKGWIIGDQRDTTNTNFESVILEWNGSSFSEVYSIGYLTSQFLDAFALSVTDVWVVGDYGTITHWDGSSWQDVSSPTSDTLNAVSMHSSTNGWAVGSNGTIIRYKVPLLSINYNTGAPGSYFTITGTGFPANSPANISINSLVLGTEPTDANGDFTFLLSTSSADEGVYYVTVSVNPSATVQFILDSNEPIRVKDGTGTIFSVPAGIVYKQVFLPLVIE